MEMESPSISTFGSFGLGMKDLSSLFFSAVEPSSTAIATFAYPVTASNTIHGRNVFMVESVMEEGEKVKNLG